MLRQFSPSQQNEPLEAAEHGAEGMSPRRGLVWHQGWCPSDRRKLFLWGSAEQWRNSVPLLSFPGSGCVSKDRSVLAGLWSGGLRQMCSHCG